MRERGLPLFRSAPLALFSQQIFLHEEVNATFGIIGARNTVFFNVYRAKTEPLTELGRAAANSPGTGNDTPYGTSVVWTSRACGERRRRKLYTAPCRRHAPL